MTCQPRFRESVRRTPGFDRHFWPSQARRALFENECNELLDQEKINTLAIELAENLGIIFLDVIDKVVASDSKSADVPWFEIAPGKGRPEQRFCSNACSMRAYRKRKATKK